MRSLDTAPAPRASRGYFRQLLPGLLKVPLLGRMIHIASALYRMPETRASIDNIARHQHDAATQVRQELHAARHELHAARHDGTLPPEVQNLLMSMPPALRQLHRAQQDIAAQFQAQAEQMLAQARAASDAQLSAYVQRLEPLAQRLDALAQQVGNEVQCSQTLIERSDALAQSIAQLGTQLEATRTRQEFVRRELMFEFRYGSGRTSNLTHTQPAAQATVEIVDPKKFDAARREGRLKLNLGCGHVPIDGYLNVDLRKLPGVDIVSGVEQLPVQPGEVAEIMSAHLLEHFPQEQLVRELLPYWKSLLRPGGTFRAVVPDAEAMIAQFSANQMQYDTLREVTFGAQDYDGDFHYNMFTPQSLAKLLEAADFHDVQVLARGRPNGDCLEFEIRAANGKE
jgi:hypothetical protein